MTHHASAFESNSVAILSALAFSFVVILIVVIRCAWPVYRGSSRSPVQLTANRESKEIIIEVLPKFTYNSSLEDKGCGKLSSSDCAICLAEYADGDEISVLPVCGHGYHVGCIDTWLTSHSSCPSCRQIHNGHLGVQK